MMLRIILISFFYFIQVSVFCQEEVIFEEKFKDNSNNWLTIDNLDGLIKIQNRSYIIEPKASPALITQHEVKIDPNRDFSISCTTIWTGNTDNDYFGLTWGANANNKDFFFFGIKANGLYSNNIFTSNKWSFPFLNAPSGFINKKGSNKIEIKKVGSIIYFYINDNKVNEAKFETLFGDGVGFYVSSKQQIIFDDLKVSYDEKLIITNKTAPVVSQENVIFEENFKNNFNNWVTFDDLTGSINIKNNSYSIEPKNSPALLARQEVKIDPSRDFSISSSTVWNGGISNNVFGLSWGGSDSKNFHVFGITADGLYGYEINSSDVWSRRIERTPSIYINKKGNNKIEIKKVGSIIKFYINNNKVNEANFETFFGNNVGFYVSSKQQIIFDDLKVSYGEKQLITEEKIPDNSQEIVIFDEKFKDNFNNWATQDDLSGLIKIKNNSYIIEPKNSPALIARHEVKIDPSRDFSISSSTVWNSGIDGSFYGLSWGTSDSKNLYNFAISANGHYTYIKITSNVFTYPIEITPSIYINKKGKNKIEIKKVGSIIKFYINDNKVNEANFESFFGNNVGFYVSSKQQVIFNNLKVSYDKKQVIIDNKGPEITISEPTAGRGVTIDDSKKQVLIKGKATDISGIYEVTINGIIANLNASGDFEQKINLAVGNNSITVEAKDTKNNIGSYTFNLNRKEETFNEIASNDAPINKIEKRLALVKGNANYEGNAKLKNPLNDANLMSNTLENLGFEVIKRIDANKQSMEQAIKEFSRKLPNFNVALFYYAGHGVQVDGVNWFIPTDAKLIEKTDCKFEAISVNFVVEEFDKYPENVNLVILDACRNNPFRGWSRGGDQGFKAINPSRGTIISYATSEGSTASDGVGENGLFTNELVKQMNIPQSIESVFKKTRVQVLKISNGGQSPQEWTQLTGDFYFKK